MKKTQHQQKVATCRRKKRYPTKADADRDRALIPTTSEHDYQKSLEVYKCSVCGGWHVGNRPRSKVEKIGLLLKQIKQEE